VRLGYFLSNISKPLLALFAYPVWVFFVRTLDRLGKGVRTAARDALLSNEATPKTKGRVFGFHRSMDTVGAAIGPLLALIYLFIYPRQYTTLFYLAFIPGLFSILLLFLLREKKQIVPAHPKGNFFSFFSYWKVASPEYRRVSFGLLLFSLFNSSDVFLLLITRETIGQGTLQIWGITFHADTITIAAYVVYNLIYAIFSYPMGVLADRFSFKAIIISGLIVFAVVYGGFAFNPSIPMIFSLFALYGIYSAATEGVIKAWLTNLAAPHQTATAIGFYTSCESLCTLLASVIAGTIWVTLGSSSTFLATSGIALIVCVFLLKAKAQRT